MLNAYWSVASAVANDDNESLALDIISRDVATVYSYIKEMVVKYKLGDSDSESSFLENLPNHREILLMYGISLFCMFASANATTGLKPHFKLSLSLCSFG